LPADQATLRAALHCDTGDSTWTDAPGLGENKPMNCMTWYEAFAFCVWDGGRVPTEAEWNYAAAGGSEQRPYPWGMSIDPSHAVYDCTGDGSAAQDCQSSDILDVGSRSPRGDGKWGHADLAGSMWEWTLDADTTGAYPDPCVDCADVTTTSLRVYRGGGWFSPADNVLVSRRSSIDPSTRVNRIGVRCARGP
jgi:formylglycine-generating enzyme required for sulfatase activity